MQVSPDVKPREDLNRAAQAATEKGSHSEAMKLYRQAIEHAERHRRLDRVFADSLIGLANLHRMANEDDQAEPLLRLAINIREQVLGTDAPDVAQALQKLADLCSDLGRFEEAEPLYERSLEVLRRVPGANPQLGRSLTNLANLYRTQGRHQLAETFYRQAIELQQRMLGNDHPELAGSMTNLAALHIRAGEDSDAQPLLERALEIYRSHYQVEHPLVAENMQRLADLYDRQEKFAEAERMHRSLLQMKKRLLGNDSADVADSLERLASILGRRGETKQAEEYFEEALRIRTSRHEPGDAEVARCLSECAHFYKRLGRFEEAERMATRALAGREQAVGNGHRDLAPLLNNLALLKLRLGHHDEAEKLLRRTARIQRQNFGVDSPPLAVTMFNLGLVCRDAGNLEDAEQHLHTAQRIQETTQSVELSMTLQALGQVQAALDKLKPAEQSYRKLAMVWEQEFGENDARVGYALWQQGILQARLEDFNEASRIHMRALRILKQTLGFDHHHTLACQIDLAKDYYNLGRGTKAQPLYAALVQQLKHLIAHGPENAKPDFCNLLAWILATCPIEQIRHGREALKFIDQALQAAPDDWHYLHTKAAALAEERKFVDAMDVARRAAMAAPDSKRDVAEEALASYQKNQAIRDTKS